MRLNTGRYLNFFNILISITAFLQLQPYFVWNNNYVRYAYISILFVLGYFLIVTRALKVQKKNLILLILTIFISIYLNYDGLKIVAVNLIFSIPLLVYILVTTDNKKKIYSCFSYIFAIALIPSIIIYFCNICNIGLNWTYLEPLNPLKGEAGNYYKQYFGAIILVNPYSTVTGSLYRLCGMFDEPGVVGTISALILAGRGYKFKKNYVNIIIFIGGILSFSLFFYIITLVYYFIAGIFERKYKKVIIGISILAILSVFSTGVINNDFINNSIIKRMTIQDGKLEGDNRTTEYFDAKYEEFLESDISTIVFGMGRGASHDDKLLEASASWKKLVFDRGIVGITLLIIFLLIIMLMFNKTASGIVLFLVMVASIYQRPGVFDLPNILIFSGGLINQVSIIDLNKFIKNKS